MKIIVGLGNPGIRYRKTRHNLGFWVVDTLANEAGIHWKKKRKFMVWLGQGNWENKNLVIVKPVTYVNASGSAVRAVADYFGLSGHDLLVVVDDVNLEPGMIRVRPGGGAGGHHGLESIIRSFGTRDFPRIRIGIGGGGLDDLTSHVLSRPPKTEEADLQESVSEAVGAITEVLRHGIESAMNRYNKKIIPTDEEVRD